ncbi:hypothetical protein JVT61DRAFT_2521 [Boletus reticuloceps]|uniref:Uncharacterized protein n=1 Tax=Boletus reticuloceps TaxID=495285 RepID=A0A8I2YRG4_9AGAM|nr:hypothetical protein JVT61DRAFT_2521 [Boletus reticuloceps]
MEVDMQSPPPTFRPMPLTTVKRPRSPGSPSQERQTVRDLAQRVPLRVLIAGLQKRPSLAPVGLEGYGLRRASTASDGVADGRMAKQDDWVRQARDLSITSPLSVTAGFPLTMVSEGGDATVAQTLSSPRVDEHMVSPHSGTRVAHYLFATRAQDEARSQAVDDEASQTLRGHVHSNASHSGNSRSSHLPCIHITTTATAMPSPAPFSVLTEPSSSSNESASSESPISVTQTNVGARVHPCPPDIFLFPATPSDTPSHQHQFAANYQARQQHHHHQQQQQQQQQDVGESEPGQDQIQTLKHSQALLTRTQGRGEGSPRPSRVPDVPTSVSKKHRVTMGPRADCVKCRTGVRGHWMHFD